MQERLRVKNKCRLQACNFIKKETLPQAFSCEFYEISKSTFFTEHLQTAASYSRNASTSISQFQTMIQRKLFALQNLGAFTGLPNVARAVAVKVRALKNKNSMV